MTKKIRTYSNVVTKQSITESGKRLASQIKPTKPVTTKIKKKK